MVNFPTSLDPLPNPGKLASGMSFDHDAQHANANDILRALEAKLGIGASVPGASAAVLRRTAAGASAWGPIIGADIDPAAAIPYSKLLLTNSIVNADVAAAAAIAYSKLALTNSIVNADIAAAAAIAYSKLSLANSIVNADVAAAAAIAYSKLSLANSITSNDITNRTIVAGDIAVSTLTATEHASRAITNYGGVNGACGTTGPGWAYTGLGVTITGLEPGQSLIYIAFSSAFYNGTAGAVCGAGIGIDTTAGPSWTVYAHEPAANYVLPYCVVGFHLATASGHSYYPLAYCNAGAMVGYGQGQLALVVLHR
jgi:hypothetical protein